MDDRLRSPLMDAVRRNNEGLEFYPADDPPRCEESERSENPCRSPKCVGQRKSGLLDSFLGDSDALLIVALIFLLMSEKADKKLIFALAFVLLS